MIPLCHNRLNGVGYCKINFKFDICSAFNLVKDRGFCEIFDYNHCWCSDYLLHTVTACGYIIRYSVWVRLLEL